MSEQRRSSLEYQGAQDPYADVPGQPYPDTWLEKTMESYEKWNEGRKAIEKRMEEEEKTVVRRIRSVLREAKDLDDLKRLFEAFRAEQEGVEMPAVTVSIYPFSVKIEKDEYHFFIAFVPRERIVDKDKPVQYILEVSPMSQKDW